MYRKDKRWKRSSFRLALTAVLGATLLALGIATCFLIRAVPEPTEARLLLAKEMKDEREVRPIYPYSVIPGGVRDAVELTTALTRDAVARRHYAGFRAENAVLISVREDRQVYVSYRLHDKIYWTAHKVRLTHGEFLLTDGEHTVRARCGNRVSDTAQAPTVPAEPAEAAMDWLPPERTIIPDYTVEMELPPVLPYDQPGLELRSFGNLPIASIASQFQEPPAHRILVVNRPWIGTPTPEPSTYLLIGGGLAVLLYKRAKTSRQRGR